MRLKSGRGVRAITGAIALLVVTVGLQFAAAAPSEAASAADFDPGYLVSDADFFDGSALTAAQIDAFIDGMNKGCATSGRCLEDYRESITAKAATTRCAAISAATNRTAGQIIYAVAKACGIGAKAILVILQKEQSLVTATAPGSHAFAYAMGAGCPDSTGCTTAYKGLYAQVYYGASLLKGYTLPSSSSYTRYQAGKTSAIRYSPTSSCGTKSVYVKNQATHALYVYTPYTPNAAALSNLYGTGNSCSAYGNRNFWRMYTDWWGPTGSAGALAVDALYTKLGGSAGSLGARVGTIATSTAKGAGLYQKYKNGIVAWNIKHGAYVITGPFAAAWAARIGDFGWPTQGTVTITGDDPGMYQNFDSALLTQVGTGKVYTVWSDIRASYIAAHGPKGIMGWPAAFQAVDGDGIYTQEFTKGTVFRKASKVGFVSTPLVEGFTTRGGVTGTLGWPTAAATTSTDSVGGTWQPFDKGTLFASSLGTEAVYGSTLTKFNSLGGLPKVGWPLTPRAEIDDSSWLRQDFENGSILVKDAKNTAYLATEFVPSWVASGFTTGTIGAPTKNPVRSSANGGGVYQAFAKATLVKSAASGSVYRLSGLSITAWSKSGGASGTLGWPVSKAAADSSLKLTVQSFQKGVVIRNSTKYGIVGANEWALAKKLKVGSGTIGWPTAAVKKAAGGEYQTFTSGAILWREDRGAVYVPKVIWNARSLGGGINGALGWPKGPATTDSKTGKVTQKFDGGTLTWTKSGGAKFTAAKG